MKDQILRHLERVNGVKAVDLALHMIQVTSPKCFDTAEYHSIVADLIQAGEIVELEYVEHGMEYRVKSMYFQKGTVFLKGLPDGSNSQNSMAGESERNT